MRKVLEINNKVVVYGSKKDVEEAISILNIFCYFLTNDPEETRVRKRIQTIIDDKKLKADILYDGNTVWSKNKVLKGIKRVKKNGMKSMTKYLYSFLTLSCGSIAHYNMFGWIEEYPTIEDLKIFFMRNEFGQRVLNHIPIWNTDVYEIVVEIERELDI
jgi:hypothetical protein